MRAERTAGPEGPRARGRVRDSTIRTLRELRGGGRGGREGPGVGGSAPRCPGVGPQERLRAQHSRVSTGLGSLQEPPGSCREGRGGARGLAHVRRVWRVAMV